MVVDELVQKAYTHFYTDRDSAYYYFNRLKHFYTEKEEWENVVVAYISINRLAGYHYSLGLMKESIDSLSVVFKKHDAYLRPLPYYDVYAHSFCYDQGVYYFEIHDYLQAQRAFKEIITSLEVQVNSPMKPEEIDLLSGAYRYLAKMNSEEGKYDVAAQFYNRDIRFISAKKPDDRDALFSDYRLLADLYKQTGQLEKSTRYFDRVLDFNLSNGGNQNTIITIARSLASNHLALNQPDSARYYLRILESNSNPEHPFRNQYHDVKASIYHAEHRDNLALQEYDKALSLTKKKWEGRPHPEIAEFDHKIGLLYDANRDFTTALFHYNRALELLGGSEDRVSFNRFLMLNVLKDKARMLNRSELPERYSRAIATVDTAVAVLDRLKPSFRSGADKLALIDNAFPLFEAGIEAAYYRYNATRDNSWLNRAFYYAEKSKNVLLLEALLGAKATRFGDVPEALLREEKELKAEIGRIEKNVNTAKQIDDVQRDQLFVLKNRHRDLVKTIETDYPSYFNLKYNAEVVATNTLQSALDPNAVLLSYFFGEKAVYCIGVSRQKTVFHKIPVSPNLNGFITSYYQAISNPKSDTDKLAQQSFELYRSVLDELLQAFPDKDKLIIAPDGLLNYIPFDQLNTVSKGVRYLIEDRVVSYVNSATLLMQLSEKNSSNQRVLGVAPQFKGSESGGLLPLPSNEKEVASVLRYFEGEALVGKRATLCNFVSQGSDYGLLHFATHAVLNDSLPEFSYLAFRPDGADEHLLYVSDLYNLSLNSSLVTLSACESGIGDLRRGQGFMSLAQGFYFSGASAIASSLWKIDDASSAKIMDQFYSYLSEGDKKDVALRKAKLDFIAENRENALSHPYYWSGFVISGNTAPVVKSRLNEWYMGVALLVVTGLGFGLYRRRKKMP
ncbi:CHAT domain-containing protein [Sinomicrobium sp.]